MRKVSCMKKRWIVLIVIVAVIGLFGGKIYMDDKRLQEEMLEVVKSDEAKEVFERVMKNLDSKALTKEGTIQSYEIDFGSVKQNPMGGINVILIINQDDKQNAELTINRMNDKLKGGGVSLSEKLTQRIDGDQND